MRLNVFRPHPRAVKVLGVVGPIPKDVPRPSGDRPPLRTAACGLWDGWMTRTRLKACWRVLVVTASHCRGHLTPTGFQLLCCLLKTVDNVLFLSGNSVAVFAICFHFLDDLVYYLVAAQTRIGFGIASRLGKKFPTVAQCAIFTPRWLPSRRGLSRAENRTGGSDV
jgi:hypothetical protein